MLPIRCLLAALSLPTLAPAATQTPRSARLAIDDEVYNVPLGEEFAIRIRGERVTVRIDPQNDLPFDQAGVSFRYPPTLRAADPPASEGVRVWTLQGPNAAIMIQHYEDGLDAKSLLDAMVNNLVEQAKGKKTDQRKVKLTGAERAYAGVQVVVATPAAAGNPATSSVQNVFTFANEQGVFALMVQDVHAAGAKPSDEYGQALRLLGESLRTGEEPQPAPTEGAAEPRVGRER